MRLRSWEFGHPHREFRVTHLAGFKGAVRGNSSPKQPDDQITAYNIIIAILWRCYYAILLRLGPGDALVPEVPTASGIGI